MATPFRTPRHLTPVTFAAPKPAVGRTTVMLAVALLTASALNLLLLLSSWF